MVINLIHFWELIRSVPFFFFYSLEINYITKDSLFTFASGEMGCSLI